MIWLIQFYFRCRQTGLRQPVSRGKRPFRTTSKTPSANALRIGPEAAPPRPSAAVSAAIVVHPIPTAGTAKEPNNLRRHTLRSEGVKKLQILRRGYWAFRKIRYLCPANGGLAQLARALAWHARGHEFESRILHHKNGTIERWSRFSVYVSGRIGRTRHKRHKRHKSIRAGLHPQH